MIFVALGTQKFQLNRLLRQLDEAVGAGTVRDEIVAQVGTSDYQPRNYRTVAYLSGEEFEACVERSDVVVTHGGVGTIMLAFQKKKPVIVFPRLAKYQEHVDDHQVEIAQAFADKNYTLLCRDGDDIARLIEEARTHSFCTYISQTARIVKIIEDFLEA